MENNEEYHSLTDDQWAKFQQAQELIKSIKEEVGKDFYCDQWSIVNNIYHLLTNTIKDEMEAREEEGRENHIKK